MREAFIESYQVAEVFGWSVWMFKDSQCQQRIICRTFEIAEQLKKYWIEEKLVGF